MDIEEIRERKAKLQSEIAELCILFMNETGMAIADIIIDRKSTTLSNNESVNVYFKVKIEVEI